MTEEARTTDANGKNGDATNAPRRTQAVILTNGAQTYEIFPDQPLADLKQGPLNAYAARAQKSGGDHGFAIICDKSLPPRTMAVNAYGNIISENLLFLLAHGVIYWPPAGAERYVFIYRHPKGQKIQKDGEQAAIGWRQDPTMEIIVKPMVELLKEFHEKNFAHGGIRPSNMFAVMAGAKIERFILGDCLSLPPSYAQSALFEPIERAMAQPSARGPINLYDDIYSFGVTLAVILRSNDPMYGKTEYEIIKNKMESGSYAAITGKDRFKGSVLELLRGVLHDDPKERWKIEEISSWLDGTRLSPKQSFKHKKAARPITFTGEKYIYAALLAMDLDASPSDTARLVESGELEQWFTRSLEDEAMNERAISAIKMAREKGTAAGYEEKLVSALSVALDLMAPIRYKNLKLIGDGIGTALVEAIVQKKDLNPFVDLFSQGIASNWLNNMINLSVDSGALVPRFDQCKNSIRHGKIGFGIERCVYMLCPEAPCLSEKLSNYYVRSPEDMIRTFEDLCQNGNAPAMFIDRHCAAFLSVKEQKVIDVYLYELGSNELHKRILGNLKCLAAIQKRFSIPMLPGISEIFLDTMDILYARYHDREVRATLEKAMKKYAADGDLVKMAALLSNQELIGKDSTDFKIAMREYAELMREATKLNFRLDDKKSFGQSTGKQFAAAVSSIISIIIIGIVALMQME
jgi:hypothetical protein